MSAREVLGNLARALVFENAASAFTSEGDTRQGPVPPGAGEGVREAHDSSIRSVAEIVTVNPSAFMGSSAESAATRPDGESAKQAN